MEGNETAARENIEKLHSQAIAFGLACAKTDRNEIYFPISSADARKTRDAAHDYMNACLAKRKASDKRNTAAIMCYMFWTGIASGHSGTLYLTSEKLSAKDFNLIACYNALSRDDVYNTISRMYHRFNFMFSSASKNHLRKDLYLTDVPPIFAYGAQQVIVSLVKAGWFKSEKLMNYIELEAFPVIVCPYEFCMGNENLKSVRKILKEVIK